MRIEWQVRRIHGNVMCHEHADPVVRGANYRLRAPPEHAVVHNQQVRPGRYGAVDNPLRDVDRRGNTTDRTPVRQLNAVHRPWVVRNRSGTEQRIQVTGDRRQVGHGLTNAPVESTSRRDPANKRFWTESIAARVASGIRAASVGLITSLTTFSRTPRETARGVNVCSLTSRATSRKACRRSMTTLPSVTSGATAFWSAFAPIT